MNILLGDILLIFILGDVSMKGEGGGGGEAVFLMFASDRKRKGNGC